VLAAVLLSAGAALLALPPRVSSRLARQGSAAGPATPRRRWWASPLFGALVAGVTVVQVIAPPVGLVLAAGAAVAAYQWIDRSESAADRRHREGIARDLPLAADLLVACLAAGKAPGPALATVAAAVRGPLARELRTAVAQLDLGADPMDVWQQLAQDPTLGPIGRSFARASRSGSSVTSALSRCADDLRRRRLSAAQAQARSVGVRAAGPLGLCFLPAFVLVGIVPTVVGLFAQFVR